MHVIDSHTGGAPTRIVLDGVPDLGSGTLFERAQRLANKHQAFCDSITQEPRGQVAMVAALLVEPTDVECITGVIYLDAGAVLGMCGHATIGLTVTLAHIGRIGVGSHKIETPVGIVEVELIDTNTVTVRNIESRRVHHHVSLEVDGFGVLTGDIAYGGNCFFIVDPSPVPVTTGNLRELTDLAIAVREAAVANGLSDENGLLVDHVIFQDSSANESVHSRNFVLCPDNSYDRSACGTGSSARLACLAADGRLAPGDEIVQESVIGSSYRLSYQPGKSGGIIPSITGQAFIMAESRLNFDDRDPFKNGIVF